jgi:hypothetical protein
MKAITLAQSYKASCAQIKDLMQEIKTIQEQFTNNRSTILKDFEQQKVVQDPDIIAQLPRVME